MGRQLVPNWVKERLEQEDKMPQIKPLPEDVAAEKAAKDAWKKKLPKTDERCTRNKPLYMVIHPPGTRVSCPVHGWHWEGPNVSQGTL